MQLEDGVCHVQIDDDGEADDYRSEYGEYIVRIEEQENLCPCKGDDAGFQDPRVYAVGSSAGHVAGAQKGAEAGRTH